MGSQSRTQLSDWTELNCRLVWWFVYGSHRVRFVLFLFVNFFFLWWPRLCEVVILSADDWVFIFVLFVFCMRSSFYSWLGDAGFCMQVVSIMCLHTWFDSPNNYYRQFSGSLGLSAQGLISGQEWRFHKRFLVALSKIMGKMKKTTKTTTTKNHTRNQRWTPAKWQLHNQANNNENNGTYTYTYTPIHKV